MPPRPTTNLLKLLRGLMKNTEFVPEPITAYIVPSNDAHNSEYIADCDKFRAFISGFTGSAGTAVVTDTEALLWTDGRYFLQASEELDSNWTLMKEGVSTTPSQDAWLNKNLPSGSKVGVDPDIYTHSAWMQLQSQLENGGHKLIPVKNLVAEVWTERPQRPCNPLITLDSRFSGKSTGEKLADIRAVMREKRADVLVLTALDEVAWLLNLRGSDIEYNPVFFCYVIIQHEYSTAFLNPLQVTMDISKHVTNETPGERFELLHYKQFKPTLQYLGTTKDLIWLPESASYALTGLIPPKKLLAELTPVALMKAVKNPTEIKGMRNAHLKDGAALCCYFSWLEDTINAGGSVTEVSGAQKLDEFRAQQEDFIGPSFATINGMGAHGAIIHYHATKDTDVPLTANGLYLCDSGAQFKDGTTDVTRTFHFGTPTDHERECYTRVLKGQLKLASSIFPSKIKGNYLDSFAREFLWDVGLDYSHGTGHGIGSFLNVHEGPMGISWRAVPDDPGLEAGMFVSNEPGYYEDGKFGIRIEDIVQVVPAKTPFNFANRGFLTFETITFAPKQTKLVKVELLTDKELSTLNVYHQECRDLLGPLLDKQGQDQAKKWLWKETEPLTRI